MILSLIGCSNLHTIISELDIIGVNSLRLGGLYTQKLANQNDMNIQLKLSCTYTILLYKAPM